MKKKIKDLTAADCKAICHYDDCWDCPLYDEWDFECAANNWCLTDRVLNKEVEVPETAEKEESE